VTGDNKTGKTFFDTFYQPFFDATDGLYFGQASFVDIHHVGIKASGYPREWGVEDCILINSLSTNCLYVLGLQAMSEAAHKTGRVAEALMWSDRSKELKRSNHPVNPPMPTRLG